jgi:hypothetical protein
LEAAGALTSVAAMIATNPGRTTRRALALLLVCAFTGCKPAHDDRPPAPQTAAPAPPVVAPVGEDRGRKQAEDTAATPEADQSAFSHVDSAEAERAASQRGHESAGEPAPASQPGSGA